ncbi:MAG: hypothetical protein M3077_14285, partial [Candidatus Dormibacteraeota bacterium]|nr:hypothetical protein [Candidatus Dormibacteraeota bacterium]
MSWAAVATTETQAFATADLAQVRAGLAAAGEPAFRATQASQWFWRSLAPSFAAMRTLSPAARRHLEETYSFSTVTPHLRREADRGQTVKHLFKLADGRTIETVVMHYEATDR